MGGSQVSTLLLVSFCSQPGVELSVLLVSRSLTETSRGSACRGMSVSLKGQLNRNWPFVRSIFRCAWLNVAACLKHLETVDTYILWGRRGLGSAPSADARCCRAADMLGFANRTATLPVTWHHAVRKTSRNKQVASIVVTCSHGCPYSCYCSEWWERHMRKTHEKDICIYGWLVDEGINKLTIFLFWLQMCHDRLWPLTTWGSKA